MCQIADQVRVALRDYGFMMLKNTEMMEQIAELRAASMEFFKLDEDDEQKVLDAPLICTALSHALCIARLYDSHEVHVCPSSTAVPSY
jgi:isopenicillin N synthase-like dioxygenase